MKHLSWLYILLILAGCTDVLVEDISIKSNENFYATFDETESRTYVDDQIRLRWTAEDCITLFRKNTYNRQYMFTGTTGANAGGFRQISIDDDFWYGTDIPYNYAVYPHSASTQLDETDYFFTLIMPAEQTYAENSFGLGANTMVAVSESNQLTFKNVGSYLRVRLYGEDVTISSITLTSKSNEAIAGTAIVTPNIKGNPTCEMTGTGKSIRLTCPTPVTISEDIDNPTDFWIVVPPVTLTSGFSVTVEDNEENTQVYDVDKSFTFKRNLYHNLKRSFTKSTQPPAVTPASISVPQIKNISATSAQFSAYISGDYISAGIECSNYEDFSNPQIANNNIKSSELIAHFSSLSENTIYYARSYITNTDGEKSYSDIIRFVPNADYPKPYIILSVNTEIEPDTEDHIYLKAEIFNAETSETVSKGFETIDLFDWEANDENFNFENYNERIVKNEINGGHSIIYYDFFIGFYCFWEPNASEYAGDKGIRAYATNQHGTSYSNDIIFNRIPNCDISDGRDGI